MADRTTSAFDERLDLLADSGQITPTARELTAGVIAEVEAALGVTLDEGGAAPFVTHLALALTRLERGADEPPQSVAVEEEIRDRHREREVMAGALRRCGQRLGRPVPATEVAYMTVHLCALTEA